MTNVEKMITYYPMLKDKGLTSVARRDIYDRMLDLYKHDDEVKARWKWHPKERKYCDRFEPAKTFKVLPKKKKIAVFDDGINYDVPPTKGLYFVGATHFNPYTRECYYWVKIGKAKNLAERFRDYNTCNPMLWRIGFSNEYDKESVYHNILSQICIKACNHNKEWFLVDEETYFEMCKKGFAFFRISD